MENNENNSKISQHTLTDQKKKNKVIKEYLAGL